MPGVEALVVVGDKGQVELALAQVVGFCAVPQPSQLQLERGLAVTQIYQFKRTIFRDVFPHDLQVQGIFVEGQALVQVQNVKIEVLKMNHKGSLLQVK